MSRSQNSVEISVERSSSFSEKDMKFIETKEETKSETKEETKSDIINEEDFTRELVQLTVDENKIHHTADLIDRLVKSIKTIFGDNITTLEDLFSVLKPLMLELREVEDLRGNQKKKILIRAVKTYIKQNNKLSDSRKHSLSLEAEKILPAAINAVFEVSPVLFKKSEKRIRRFFRC